MPTCFRTARPAWVPGRRRGRTSGLADPRVKHRLLRSAGLLHVLVAPVSRCRAGHSVRVALGAVLLRPWKSLAGALGCGPPNLGADVPCQPLLRRGNNDSTDRIRDTAASAIRLSPRATPLSMLHTSAGPIDRAALRACSHLPQAASGAGRQATGRAEPGTIHFQVGNGCPRSGRHCHAASLRVATDPPGAAGLASFPLRCRYPGCDWASPMPGLWRAVAEHAEGLSPVHLAFSFLLLSGWLITVGFAPG